MSERDTTRDDGQDSDERLAAWLDGDSDEVTARRVMRRITEDADVAARADAIADVMARLRSVDAPAPPADLHARVVARLDRERAGRRRTATGLERRVQRRGWSRLRGVASVAAVVAALAVVAGTVVPRLGAGGTGQGQDASVVAGAGDQPETLRRDQAPEAAGPVADGEAAGGGSADTSVSAQAAPLERARPADLGTAAGRADVLADAAADLAAPADELVQPDAGIEGDGRAVPLESSEEVTCAATLSRSDARARLVRVVRDMVDGQDRIGVVTREADGTLRLRVAVPADGCVVLSDETRGG